MFQRLIQSGEGFLRREYKRHWGHYRGFGPMKYKLGKSERELRRAIARLVSPEQIDILRVHCFGNAEMAR